MKKITLKELAPYLPYGAQYKSGYGNIRKLNLSSVVKLYAYKKIDCKIILRPLSDLTKGNRSEEGDSYLDELDHMYGDCVSTFEISKNNELLYFTAKDEVSQTETHTYTERSMPWYLMEFLLQRHFDVFGLIDKGLAIDINTLSQPSQD
jgi:hypothetical protein